MPEPQSTNRTLEEFRAYLETLAYIQISPRLRSKFGRSDIISHTLWEAYQELDQLRALDEQGRKRRLRRMLINNLLEEIARWKAGRRDYRRERSLETDADASSCRLQSLLVADEPSAGEQAAAREEGLRLLEALSRLPERQREALILQRYHGWKLREIAEHLNCTVNAVAGLHAQGLKKLRQLLSESE
jgi:RNA polymerase sigma-70 factor (ECF subfamily)